MPEALRGDLSYVRLSSLLQLAEAEGATGALSFPGTGEIRLSRGDIIEAVAGPLSGYPAVRTLFFVPSGPFRLDVSEVAPDPDAPRLPPLVPVTRAVLDGVRLLDEWARIGGMILSATGPLPTLASPAAELMAMLDGARPLQALVLEARVSPALIVDPVLDLLEEAHLDEVAEAAPHVPWPGISALQSAGQPAIPANPTIPAQTILTGAGAPDYDQLLEDGRRLLREADFEAAESAFMAALAARPDDRIAAQNLRRARQLRSSDGNPVATWLRTGSGQR